MTYEATEHSILHYPKGIQKLTPKGKEGRHRSSATPQADTPLPLQALKMLNHKGLSFKLNEHITLQLKQL